MPNNSFIKTVVPKLIYTAMLCPWLLASSILAQVATPDGVVDPAATVPTSAPAPAVPEIPPQEEPEVLTSGPVHESFAGPVTLEGDHDLVVAIEPPPLIQEQPPAERPADASVVWVPGYWGWDAERQNYVWVSGCWRSAPPRMSWMPGYWTPVPGGWRWVAGYWTPTAEEVVYHSAPPPLVNIQATAVAPADNMIWVPPCWYWRDGRYVLRDGYWLQAQPGWIWVPSHYTWTPHGYVFVAGHWDYPLERRGVLFAPVYLSPRHMRIGVVYSPRIMLDLGGLTVNLFTYVRYGHYYFGDYYDPIFVARGIRPWFEVSLTRTCYDPIFVYTRWRLHGTHPRWEDDLRRHYVDRRDHHDMRPARTYREMETRISRASADQRRDLQVARPVGNAPGQSMKFERLDNRTRQQIAQQAAQATRNRDSQQQREIHSRDQSPDTVTQGAQSGSVYRRNSDNRLNQDRTDRVRPSAPGVEINPAAPRNEPRRTEIRIGADPRPGTEQTDRVRPSAPGVEVNPAAPRNEPRRTEIRIGTEPRPDSDRSDRVRPSISSVETAAASPQRETRIVEGRTGAIKSDQRVRQSPIAAPDRSSVSRNSSRSAESRDQVDARTSSTQTERLRSSDSTLGRQPDGPASDSRDRSGSDSRRSSRNGRDRGR